jgi:transcriptional regulator with XRE-family HTH domain
MDARAILGQNLRYAREQRGWSQEELAHRSGIHRTYISGLERGTRNPTLNLIAAIADALDLPVAQLVEERL